MSKSTSNEGSATTDGNALPNRDPADVTRLKAAAAKRVQAHRWRRRLGLVPDGSRQRPNGARSDQHRLPLPDLITTTLSAVGKPFSDIPRTARRISSPIGARAIITP